MNKTSIEWTDYTWNPVTGCDKVSAGCRSCYAETLAKRFWGERKFTAEKNRKKWAGKKVFVCSMSDLFHESVSDYFIHKVFVEIADNPRTTFQILTKRPERALEWFHIADSFKKLFPLKNLWLGVSCENQEQANKRIPLLLQIPAAVRFLSCEPLIGPIDLIKVHVPGDTMEVLPVTALLDWVIAGGESGHHARPMHPDWARSLRDQCKAANVPFFFKQWGAFRVWQETEEIGLYRSPSDGRLDAMPGVEYSGMENCRVEKLGKSKSGNMLDGRTHLEFPALPTANCPLPTI